MRSLPTEFEIRPALNETGNSEMPMVLPDQGVNLEVLEKSLIMQALQRAEGNRSKAAKLLYISRDALVYRINKHGITFD